LRPVSVIGLAEKINIIGQQGSRPEASKHQVPSPQQNPFSGHPEQLLARFPQKHSCQHCKEDVINALSAKAASPASFLRDRHGTIEAAKNGSKLYEWLLVFLFRSEAPANHGFYLQRTSLKDVQDLSSVEFLIGTPKYT
jgi:hypothetical protein